MRRYSRARGATGAHLFVMLAALSLISGCAKTTSDIIQEHEGRDRLPKPDRILVHDFAVSAHDVSINSGPGARIANFVTGTSTSDEQRKVGRAVANVLSEELVRELQKLGVPTQRAGTVEPPPKGTFLVEGQFVTIDEGNRLRRMVIGFGLGGTEVRTQVQASLGTNSGWLLLEEFVTSAESSKKPGMGPMVGVGAAVTGVTEAAVVSGGVGTAVELDQTVEGDARRTAREIAKKLTTLFVKEGWLPGEFLSR